MMKQWFPTVLLAAALATAAEADVMVDYTWSTTSVPFYQPGGKAEGKVVSGGTAYLVDADKLDQQKVLDSVYKGGQTLDQAVGGAVLASASPVNGYINGVEFKHASDGSEGHAYFVYSDMFEDAYLLYFSGYSTMTANPLTGTGAIVSNTFSSDQPVQATVQFQGDKEAGDGGGWYSGGVPEPTGATLLLAGLGLLALRRRRRNAVMPCVLALGAAVCCTSARAEEPGETCAYRCRSTGSRIVAPGASEGAAGTIYLFDATECPPEALLAELRKGAELAQAPLVIGREMSDGLVPTGDAFLYAGRAIGERWSAYLVFAWTAPAGERYVYFSTTAEVMGVALSYSDLVFGDQSAASAAEPVALTEEFAGAGWYVLPKAALGATARVMLSPAAGLSEQSVAAADEASALAQVSIASPDRAVVSDAQYASYFKLTAVPAKPYLKLAATPTSEGRYLVRAELDPEKIELDKTVNSMAAALSQLAAAGGRTVTVELDCKPGLSYRVLSASALTESFGAGEAAPRAAGEKVAVEVAVPQGGSAFFKVEVKE